MRAHDVVVVAGPFSRRYVPSAAGDLSSEVHQMHSYDYRMPADVPPGDVLVVGGGNSAAQLAVELAQTHAVTVAAPRPPWYLPVSVLGVDLYWWSLLSGVLNAAGREVRLADGTQLEVSSVLWCTGFRPDTSWIDVPGAVGVDGEPVHADGQSPVDGLQWMGLPWQTRLNSSIIDGVDRDARAVSRRVRTRHGRRELTAP